jgi:hypothetical protein
MKECNAPTQATLDMNLGVSGPSKSPYHTKVLHLLWNQGLRVPFSRVFDQSVVEVASTALVSVLACRVIAIITSGIILTLRIR